VTHAQRSLFAKGLVDLANIIAGALVFGQLVSDHLLDLTTLALGIILGFVASFHLMELPLCFSPDHEVEERRHDRLQGQSI
jgi:hypothetical protein